MTIKKGIDYWVKQLSQSDIPAFSYIIADINKQCSNDASSATELAESILKDTSLTSKVLKIANSVHYNPQRHKPITTVSRAVVLLGFSGIKSILLTTLLIEHVIQQKNKRRILPCLAKSLHRAVQAKFLFSHIPDADNETLEEIFIYGLIYDIAEIAFWSGNYPEAKALEQLDSETATTQQQQLLGASFHDITQGLIKHWNIDNGFADIFSTADYSTLSRAAQCMRLANRLAETSSNNWQSKDMHECMTLASQLLGMNLDDTTVLIKARADMAADIATQYGCDELCQLIPAKPKPASTIVTNSYTVSNPGLVLELLREIHQMQNQTLNINTLFHMLLEGIHRGIGMERVAIFLINKTAANATLKYGIGDNSKAWQKGMTINLAGNSDSVFSRCLQQRKDIWLRAGQHEAGLSLIGADEFQGLDINNGLIAPLYANQRPVALLLADRGANGETISELQFESFSYFSQQACQALSVVLQREKAEREKHQQRSSTKIA